MANTEKSELNCPHGRAVIDGLTWKDCTPYSQGQKRIPNTWEARISNCRMYIMRKKDGEWTMWAYSPDSPRWSAVLENDSPEEAARAMQKRIVVWLRTLAGNIETGQP